MPAVVATLVLIAPLTAGAAEVPSRLGAASDSSPVPVQTSPPVRTPELIDFMAGTSWTSIDGTEVVLEALTGSLPFTTFGVVSLAFDDPTMAAQSGSMELPTPFFIGEMTGTNPAEGTLRWSGQTFARDASQTESHGNAVFGDVEISISGFVLPHADISFSGLVDLDTGAAREAFDWKSVPLQEGIFSGGTDGNRVQGSFLGPDHDAVGGTFERDGLIGGFGAQRLPALPLPDASEVLRVSGEAARWLLPMLLDGPPSLYQSKPASSAEPRLPQMEQVLPGMIADLGGTASLSLSLQGLLGGGYGEYGELALTVGSQPGLPARSSGLRTELTAFAGADHQVGYASFTSGFGPGDETDARLDFASLGEIDSTSLAFGGYGVFVTPPTGTAQWSGTLRAQDTSASHLRGNRISGNVLISLDLQSDPQVDVQFTDLVDQNFGRTLEDLSWTAIPVSRGNFGAQEGDNFLRGAFAGFDHSSAAGIFDWNDLSGGFVAARRYGSDPWPEAGAGGPESGMTGVTKVQFHVSFPVVAEGFDNAQAIEAVAAMEGLLRNAQDSSGNEDMGLQRLSLAGTSIGGVAADLEGFGEWLDQGYFGVVAIQRSDAEGVQHRWASAAVMVMGGAADPPAVSAHWTGEMVGIDISGTAADGNWVRGNASVTLRDGSYLQATVAFSGIVDLTTGRTRPDMWWGGLPVVDGQFRSHTRRDQIDGRFLGPDQSRTVGVFEWHMIQGAFGAQIVRP